MFNLNNNHLNVIELKNYMNLKEITSVFKILGLVICSLILISSIMIHFGNSLAETITCIVIIFLFLFLLTMSSFIEKEKTGMYAKRPIKDLYLNMLNSEARELFKTYLVNGQIITNEIFDKVLAQEIDKKNQQLKNNEIQRQLEILNND